MLLLISQGGDEMISVKQAEELNRHIQEEMQANPVTIRERINWLWFRVTGKEKQIKYLILKAYLEGVIK
jgi:hypothetical protein